ncbi:hypothetical protein [Francisella marina]|uniref:Response regulator n=1 Tax=Francisella marina TaxID=2249302 RepID=A0ABX5ZI93_9GAMM|nr:hypothetical protein [Francisella marina]QEO57747.1 hypothetical protein F0R74_07725 [Francisella marina]QEO60027.1 hypothetical protein F0R75_09590 [Francisella marina]
MKKYNILIIEDQMEQFERYKEVLDYDDDLSNKYSLINAKTVEEAKTIISNTTIHASILDLEIPLNKDEQTMIKNGEDLLIEILEEKRFPIFVVSGNAESLDKTKLPPHVEPLIKESNVYEEVFNKFDTINGLLDITTIIPEAIEDIGKDFTTGFWELWSNWKVLEKRFKISSEKEKLVLKRYLCAHMMESWLANDIFGEIHHTEFYTYPLIRESIYTGDIIEYEDSFWIVVTPPCDLSNGCYPENLTLLKCEGDGSDTKNRIGAFSSATTDAKRLEKKEKIIKLFTAPEVSKHYLPAWDDKLGPQNIMFKKIRTIEFSESKRKDIQKSRVAAVSSHILPYIMQRYGAYVSRVGQPSVMADAYIDYMIDVLSSS